MSGGRRGQAPADSGVWDHHAGRYRSQEHLEARAVATAVRLADATACDAVVDLATGTGAIPRALAACPKRPGSVVGVDRSEGMLGRVGPLPEGWSVIHADARQVPLANAVADVVTCSYLLHLLPSEERHAVLREAHRLLRPGPRSRLIVITVWADGRRPGGRCARIALRTAARLRPSSWGGLALMDPTADLERAGFRCVRRVQLPRGGYPSLVIRAIPERT